MSIIEQAVEHMEARRAPGAPRPGVVPSTDIGGAGEWPLSLVARRPLRSNQQLADIKLFHDGMRDEITHAALTNLRTHTIQRLGTRSVSIVVSSVCDRGGASFVASNLAAAFCADPSASAVLVDCNFSGQRYLELGDDGSHPGLTDYIENDDWRIEDILMDIGISRLRLITGGTSRGTQGEYFTRGRVDQLFRTLTKRSNVTVIVDAPPALLSANARVLTSYCDAALLVVPYGKVTQSDIRAAARALPQEKLLSAVFNNVPHWSNEA